MGADDNTNGLRSELRRIKDWVLMSGNSLPNVTAFIWQVSEVLVGRMYSIGADQRDS